MTKNILRPLAALFLFSCLLFSCGQDTASQNKTGAAKSPVAVETFRVAAGWGYSIIIDGKAFIRQENIPAIPGNKAFALQSDAEKVAQCVVRKMEKQQRINITTDDLRDLGILAKEE